MPRLKRSKKLREGDAVYIKERQTDETFTSLRFIELYANNRAYKGDQVCLGIGCNNSVEGIVQTTVRELEDAIVAFRKLRGIKRVSKVRK